MNDKEIEVRLYDLLASCVPDRKVSKSLKPEMMLRRDLGLDSVQLALLLFKFEEEFGIEMPDAALARGAMTSVGELIQAGMEVLRGEL